MFVACGLLMAGQARAEGEPAVPSARDISATPELVVAAIRDQSVERSAAIVVAALDALLATDWSEARKREHCIALITYAEAIKGKDAAPMMRLVIARVPPAWRALIAATAVVAAGDNSPAVAKAILEAVAGNAQDAESCRSACDNPTTVLLPTEVGVVRGIMLPTPTQAPAKAPPLPTIIRPADLYPGQ
jgi:hypothetical protein